MIDKEKYKQLQEYARELEKEIKRLKFYIEELETELEEGTSDVQAL